MNIDQLALKAKEIRIQALEAAVKAQKGHLGGTFSCVELLVSLFYGKFLKFNEEQENLNDLFILSKGHACLGLYPIMKEYGWITEKDYLSYGINGGRLGGQLDTSLPNVKFNTGSLGHALGVCAGYAMASRKKPRKICAVTLMGDAEFDEGSVWEAIIFAGQNKISGLIGIIDRNRLSVTQKIEASVIFDDFESKMKSFEWECITINGHSLTEIRDALDYIKGIQKPVMILANTIKGKGISFMENELKWHHSVPSESELKIAYDELGKNGY